jgi:hypothetical protein
MLRSAFENTGVHIDTPTIPHGFVRKHIILLYSHIPTVNTYKHLVASITIAGSNMECEQHHLGMKQLFYIFLVMASTKFIKLSVELLDNTILIQ